MKLKTTSITKARKDIFKIAEELQQPEQYYVLTISGAPQVVMMSQDSFEQLLKQAGTELLMREDPRMKYRITHR